MVPPHRVGMMVLMQGSGHSESPRGHIKAGQLPGSGVIKLTGNK